MQSANRTTSDALNVAKATKSFTLQNNCQKTCTLNHILMHVVIPLEHTSPTLGRCTLDLLVCAHSYMGRWKEKKNETKIRPCAFFFYVSRHFFFTKPTRAREKKNNVQRKKKTHWLSVPRPPGRQMTHLAHCVEHTVILFFFFFFFFQTMIK